MSRNRVIYNVLDVLVGPPDDSLITFWGGGHYLKRLSRVQSFTYNFVKPSLEVQELGREGFLTLPLGVPSVTFDFEYLNAGITNEYNLGLNVNYGYFFSDSGLVTDFRGASGVNFVSGFFDDTRNFDGRNFYVLMNNSLNDLKVVYPRSQLSESSGIAGSRDPLSSGYSVACFVNSYLNSYESMASVGEFPSVRLSYLADSMLVYSSGSGVKVPSLNQSNGSVENSPYDLFIPRRYSDIMPSVLRPGDITLDINSNYISNLPFNVSDLKVASFSFAFDLTRDESIYIGQTWPSDRPPKTPIRYTVSLDGVFGDLQSGNLANLSSDAEYNINVNIKCPTGDFSILKYAFRNVELGSITSNSAIGQNSTFSLIFNGQMIPSSIKTGVFVSGIGNELDVYLDTLTKVDGEIIQTVGGENINGMGVFMTQNRF